MYIATLEASIVWKGKFAENKYLSTDTSPLHADDCRSSIIQRIAVTLTYCGLSRTVSIPLIPLVRIYIYASIQKKKTSVRLALSSVE